MKRAVFAVLLLASAGVAAQSNVPAGFDPIQGAWSLVSVSGMEVPAGASTLIITGNTYRSLTDGKVDETGTIKFDPSTKPMRFDMVIATGKDAGKTQLGVAEISGDTMTLVMGEPGDTKPPKPQMNNTLRLKRTAR